jgi:hypothetical protein
MTNNLAKLLMFMRDRWRWVRGRCPLCNRNLYAAFPYYMTAYPNCPVCKDETETDLRMWRKHRTWVIAKRIEFAPVRVITDMGESDVQPHESRRV